MNFPICGDLGTVCVVAGPVMFLLLIVVGGRAPRRCSRCGHRNRVIARYCARCGTLLPRIDDE